MRPPRTPPATSGGSPGRARGRLAFAAAFATLALALFASRGARAAGDPYLVWRTIETAHFRVHYPTTVEPIADRVAELAESVHTRLVPVLGWTPSQVTEIVLTDSTDDANGSATALPYDTVRLYVTAPDDLSPLGEYDDWYLELLTHEYTHILHSDHVTGPLALYNAILGKTFAPNQAQPRWVLEGLAVLEESRHTSGGRNHSSLFDMYLRADTIEDELASLDQVSHYVRRWPQGNVWYLYGSRFLTWISDVYGDRAMRDVSADYGAQVVPYAINRSIRRATGRTYEELYDGFRESLREKYGAQIAAAAKSGLREGTRLTHHGQWASAPRWVPRGRAQTGADELIYYRDDARSRSGFHRLVLRDREHADEDGAELVARADSQGSASFGPDGDLVFDSTGITSRIYAFQDLFRLPPGESDASGFSPARRRITWGKRARTPDVAPDGEHVVFVENHHGTSTLVVARLGGEEGVEDARVLVPSAPFEQAYTPRWSPDGRLVAYSAWTEGGFRDVRIVDVATGTFREITHDRAQDWEPAWSADGSTVYFSSDRALGIPNVFAFDVATGKLWQVTNVRTGAFYPAPSPDDRTLAYVGYGSKGFDLWTMPLDRSTWVEAAPYVDARLPGTPHVTGGGDAAPRAKSHVVDRHPYRPLGTLRPRNWEARYGPGTYGQRLSISTTGRDAVGHHSIAATVYAESARPEIQGSITYGYGRLPFDLRLSAYRSVVPRTGFRYGGEQPVFQEENVGISSGLYYSLPAPFETESFALSYSMTRFRGALPLSASAAPDSGSTIVPPRGYLGAVHLGWGHSNAESTVHGVGLERGFTLSAGADVATGPLASDYSLYVFGYSATGYVPMPWLRHHTLALHVGSSFSSGDYPGRGLFYAGGYLDSPLVDQAYNPIYQGAFVLRGYPAVAFIGSQYHLANAEYRFPIAEIEHGPSTLPFFVNRVSGNLFADYGGAFDDLDRKDYKSQFHLGVGAEAWIDLTFGYVVAVDVRIGHARGVKDDAAVPGGQTYLVLVAPY